MKRVWRIVCGLALCLVPSLAMSDSHVVQGLYGFGGVGLNLLTDSDVSGGGTTNTVDFDKGFAGMAGLGYGLGNGLRLEGEIGFRDNDADGTGSAKSWNFMGNLLYEFPLKGNIHPYIGAGIGAVRTKYEDNLVAGSNTIDDTDMVFGYQGIAGIAIGVHEQIDLTLDYRYLGTADSTFSTAAGGNVDAEYDNHTIMLGFRWMFGAPRKPAPEPKPIPVAQPTPTPAPTPAPELKKPAPIKAEPKFNRSFLVFFDWDKADITPEAREILRQAAINAKGAGVTRINLTGHADRSGPARYNMGLSMRRAGAVKRELVGFGVAEKDIGVVAKGETDPLVPTPDGVREPQNRRVEIVF